MLKAWTKARWKNQPLTLKDLHDEFSKAWADVGDDPVKWENVAEEDAEKATDWRPVETYIRGRTSRPIPNPKRSKCRWKPICIITGCRH